MMSNLAEKIAAASKAVGALATDKRNAQQGYDYISADKILDRAGGALATVGVILIPAITSEEIELRPTPKGGERFDAKVAFTMTISDGETTLDFPWVGRGSDYSVPDKATYKAITSGHKYFLAKLLNIGVGNEDGEHEVETPVKAQTPVAAQKTQQRPAAPATGQTGPEGAPAANDVPKASEAQLKKLHTVGTQAYGKTWDEKRHQLVQMITKGASESSNDLTPKEADSLINGIENKLAEMAAAKFDGETPEERGATPPLASTAASKRMAARIQNGN